jgi:hypothetical protein
MSVPLYIRYPYDCPIKASSARLVGFDRDVAVRRVMTAPGNPGLAVPRPPQRRPASCKKILMIRVKLNGPLQTVIACAIIRGYEWRQRGMMWG